MYVCVPFSRSPFHQDKVSIDLGFYYMANAGGRLVGTLIGGFLYQYTVGTTNTSLCGLSCLAVPVSLRINCMYVEGELGGCGGKAGAGAGWGESAFRS